MEAEAREDCGEEGITQDKCEDQGCCYDDSKCFRPAQKGEYQLFNFKWAHNAFSQVVILALSNP